MDEPTLDRIARVMAARRARRDWVRLAIGVVTSAPISVARVRWAAAQETALPPGAACTSTAQCSQAGGSVVCADNGYADDGGLNCCANAGGACFDATFSRDCCGGLYCRGGVCSDLSTSGDLPPGSYCTSTAQCSQTGGAVVCAANGLSSDGALNCCRTEGGACSIDAGCCGGLSCVDGVCEGDAVAGGSLALGASCAATAECAPSSGGTVVCASNNIDSDGALNCCLQEGGACGGNSSLCCGNLFCVEGGCAPPPFGDLQPGAVCSATVECSQDGGPTVCADNGLSGDGALNCCRLEASPCGSDAECCANLVCGDNFIDDDGPLTCCGVEGSACGSDAGCCGFLFCVEGVCQP